MTRDEAMTEYRALVNRYGLQWTARNVPDQEAWLRMSAVNEVLTTADRREALGWPRDPKERR
jgi:hypothetical protein